MKQPKTVAEWRKTVNLSEALLCIDSARQYGLITGGPRVNVDRAVELLAEGARRGHQPDRAAVGEMIRSIVRELDIAAEVR